MAVRLLTTEQECTQYDAWIKAQPHGSLWQSLERRRYLDALGKETRLYVLGNGHWQATALVAIDRTSFGLSTWEIPRGPVGTTCAPLIDRIVADAKQEGCMALYASPVTAVEIPCARPSQRHVHCEATRIVDLTATEEEILAHMKQKGRYNIRVAEKGGVTVHDSTDIAVFAALAQQTGNRDGFIALPKAKYEAFLHALPGSFLLLAYDTKKTPVAGLLGVVWNGRGIYYYGASSYAHRALMAPYALQWAAIRRCKAAGCKDYDLLGIAPPDAGAEHPWAGITRFKEQFGGTVHTYPVEQEVTLQPVAKILLDWKRRIF